MFCRSDGIVKELLKFGTLVRILKSYNKKDLIIDLTKLAVDSVTPYQPIWVVGLVLVCLQWIDPILTKGKFSDVPKRRDYVL